MQSEIDLHHVEEVHARSKRLLDLIKQQLDMSSEERTLPLRFNVRQAAKLVGRSENTIRRAEDSGELPPAKKKETGVREGYTLADLNVMRDAFNTLPWREEHEEPVVLSFQNFKGGVGKSTTSVHAAQYFALQGYRVLMVDLDPQATATLLFGFNPATDIGEEDTALPFFESHRESLDYAVRSTHWPGLDLIPSNLQLYNAEYLIAADTNAGAARFERLRDGIADIAVNYDVVILDPPPALGMISINALAACNALIVPTPPAVVDYASTVTFFQMLTEVIGTLEDAGVHPAFKFLQVLPTRVDENKMAQKVIRDGMRKVFGNGVLSTALIDSSEYNTGSAEMRTVYEYTGPSNKTYRRCRANLDRVMGDIEEQVRFTWRSHQRKMRIQGAA